MKFKLFPELGAVQDFSLNLLRLSFKKNAENVISIYKYANT